MVAYIWRDPACAGHTGRASARPMDTLTASVMSDTWGYIAMKVSLICLFAWLWFVYILVQIHFRIMTRTNRRKTLQKHMKLKTGKVFSIHFCLCVTGMSPNTTLYLLNSAPTFAQWIKMQGPEPLCRHFLDLYAVPSQRFGNTDK